MVDQETTGKRSCARNVNQVKAVEHSAQLLFSIARITIKTRQTMVSRLRLWQQEKPAIFKLEETSWDLLQKHIKKKRWRHCKT